MREFRASLLKHEQKEQGEDPNMLPVLAQTSRPRHRISCWIRAHQERTPHPEKGQQRFHWFPSIHPWPGGRQICWELLATRPSTVTPPGIILAMVGPRPGRVPGIPGSREAVGRKPPGCGDGAWQGETRPLGQLPGSCRQLSLPKHAVGRGGGGPRGRTSLDLP